jgi:alpha-galactosidase
MGLKYMLWIAPPIIGEKSSMNEVLLPSDLDKERIDGSHRLLPYRKEALELMANKFSYLIKEYDIDGLKIDYLDFFRPDTKEPKGRLMRAFAKLISEKIRNVKEDALIEYRQFYTVPGMLNYATQYRAGDVPYDWMDNFNRLAQMRITLGDNLPLHADPAFWRCDETIENVGRHMIAALAGVPMISIDFNQIPKAHIKVIANYLNLYREFLTVFQKGHWQVNYYLSNTSSLTVEYNNVKIAFINDSCRVPKNATVYFNLCNETLFLDGVDSFDQLGNRVACIPVGGYGKVI